MTKTTESTTKKRAEKVSLPNIEDARSAIQYLFAHRQHRTTAAKTFNSKEGITSHDGIRAMKPQGLLNTASLCVGILSEQASEGNAEARSVLSVLNNVVKNLPKQFDMQFEVYRIKETCSQLNASRQNPITFGNFIKTNVENPDVFIKSHDIPDEELNSTP